MIKLISTKLNTNRYSEEPRRSIYTFLERRPVQSDSDHRKQIFVYKPKGWPEILQPQYRFAPSHILAHEGYWSRIKWDRLNGYEYNHPDWRQRLLFTHWKPITKPMEGFLFTNESEINPDVPDGLTWDTIDWSDVEQTVEEARSLIEAGSYADREQINNTHQRLQYHLEEDDPFYLNQWLLSFRMHGWKLCET